MKKTASSSFAAFCVLEFGIGTGRKKGEKMAKQKLQLSECLNDLGLSTLVHTLAHTHTHSHTVNTRIADHSTGSWSVRCLKSFKNWPQSVLAAILPFIQLYICTFLHLSSYLAHGSRINCRNRCWIHGLNLFKVLQQLLLLRLLLLLLLLLLWLRLRLLLLLFRMWVSATATTMPKNNSNFNSNSNNNS